MLVLASADTCGSKLFRVRARLSDSSFIYKPPKKRKCVAPSAPSVAHRTVDLQVLEYTCGAGSRPPDSDRLLRFPLRRNFCETLSLSRFLAIPNNSNTHCLPARRPAWPRSLHEDERLLRARILVDESNRVRGARPIMDAGQVDNVEVILHRARQPQASVISVLPIFSSPSRL